MPPPRSTIFALSSGRPPAAIAVVRLSGPRAGDALTALAGRLPEPRRAALARLRDPANGEPLDEALALWFPSPRSETGEHMAELQLHGGHAVVAAVLAALGRLDGLRPAEAGEFTRRAFENGRLDLTAVEGLADLIGAETEAQRRQAYRQMKGLLGDRAETWRKLVIKALALVEAGIDFSDEADVPENLLQPALHIAHILRSEIATVLAQAGRGERLRDGFVVAIAGPPNAGKSTLLNRIAKREAAIVSPHAGTTRDVIEVHLDLGGYPVTLLDTAGVRETDDPVEQEGVRRAQQRAAEADLVLWVVSADEPMAPPPARLAAQGSMADAEPPSSVLGKPLADKGKITGPLAETVAVWLVRNKVDLPDSPDRPNYEHMFDCYESRFGLSARDGAGVAALLQALEVHVNSYFGSESGLLTRERHRFLLKEAELALDRALAESPEHDDIIAEELRLASRALGRLTGKVDVEDILDVIFRDFCIGK
jgi:tRNA modification GTPase